MFVPVIGSAVVLGYLATVAISAIEGAVVVGGLSALGAALYCILVHKDNVIRYDAAGRADGFLVMAHGLPADIARAKAILGTMNAFQVDADLQPQAEGRRDVACRVRPDFPRSDVLPDGWLRQRFSCRVRSGYANAPASPVN